MPHLCSTVRNPSEVGVPEGKLSGLEAGEWTPDVKMLRCLCKLFKVSSSLHTHVEAQKVSVTSCFLVWVSSKGPSSMERLAQVGVCALLSPCTCASTPTPTPQGIGRTEHGSVGEPAGIASGAGFPSLCRQGRTQGGSLHKPFGSLSLFRCF